MRCRGPEHPSIRRRACIRCPRRAGRLILPLVLFAILVIVPGRFAASPAAGAAAVAEPQIATAAAQPAPATSPATPVTSPAAHAPHSRVAVLLYHQVDPDVPGPYTVSPSRLRADLEWLLSHGWRPVTYERFRDWLAGSGTLPEKAFLLTFDDGYEAMARSALPVLKDLGVPAVVFLTTGLLDAGKAITAESAAALARSGLVSLQCHTHALHYEMPRQEVSATGGGGGMAAAVETVSEETIAADLAKSVALIEAIAGRAPDAIAWPYGRTSTAAGRIAQTHFELQFGTAEGYVERGGGLIGRFGLDWRTHEQVRRLFRLP